MNRLPVAVFLAWAVAASDAFVPVTPSFTTSSRSTRSTTASITTSSTKTSSALSALAAPLIIGPMIKKMREGKEKDNMPMIDEAEASAEAPGLRVGTGAWKWPSTWPYDDSFFLPGAEQEAAAKSQTSVTDMASMLTGIAQAPTVPTAENNGAEEEEDPNKFNPMKYWDEEQGGVPTDIDRDAVQKLKDHYSYYIADGMSVLELGAAEDSYLPDDLKLSRHVGVGASTSLMAKNPALTDSMVVDLNKVTPEAGVDSDELQMLAEEPFDVIIMSNTVNYLTSPRETFRTAWYLLKPGGTMIVSFAGKEASKNMFPEAQTRMWREYNDDQKMWITGSFFQFSAGDGWDSLMGFDISPEDAKPADAGGNPLANLMDKRKANNMYVIQATKGSQYEAIDPEDLEESIKSLCWMLPAMEQRDKQLVVPRLARACETADSTEIINVVGRNLQHLPAIYEALIKMDQFAFTFSMQAQMAADMVSDPDFGGTEEEIMALKQGLGLRTPSPEFWAPVGEKTSAIPVEDKISLLAFIVPCFGSGDAAQEEGLQAFCSGLTPTYNVLRGKCPDLSEAEVQLLGAELLAIEVLKPGRSSREEFATWLSALSEPELTLMLAQRKTVRDNAKAEVEAYRTAVADKKEQQEEYKRTMDEQINLARQERSLIFNPKTQKMTVFDNPNKK